jgi:hypothetical protein
VPEPAEVAPVKYGDKRFKNQDPNRKMSLEERAMLIAEYVRWGCNLRKAAKWMCVSESNALDVIDQATEEDPDILNTARIVKLSGISLLQIFHDLMEKQRKITMEAKGNSVSSAIYAVEKAIGNLNKWHELMEGRPVAGDLKGIVEKETEIDAELKRIAGSSKAKTRKAKAPRAKGGTPVSPEVGGDAACRE